MTFGNIMNCMCNFGFWGRAASNVENFPMLRLRPNHYTFTLKMVAALFAETLENSGQSMKLALERRSYILKSSREKLRTRIVN
jgi:hypothetical protein